MLTYFLDENCMKMKEFRPAGACPWHPTSDPPMQLVLSSGGPIISDEESSTQYRFPIPHSPKTTACSSGSRISRMEHQPEKEGCQPIIWPKFAESCMKMKNLYRSGQTSKIVLCRSATGIGMGNWTQRSEDGHNYATSSATSLTSIPFNFFYLQWHYDFDPSINCNLQ